MISKTFHGKIINNEYVAKKRGKQKKNIKNVNISKKIQIPRFRFFDYPEIFRKASENSECNMERVLNFYNFFRIFQKNLQK